MRKMVVAFVMAVTLLVSGVSTAYAEGNVYTEDVMDEKEVVVEETAEEAADETAEEATEELPQQEEAEEIVSQEATETVAVAAQQSEETTETGHAISMYGKMEHASLTYTITSQKDGTVSKVYSATDTNVTAQKGDTITLIPEVEEGYGMSSLGYCKTGNEEKDGLLKTVSLKKGSYSFTMPDYPVTLGIAAQPADSVYATDANKMVNYEGKTYMAIIETEDSWIHESDKSTYATLYIDKRFLDWDDVTLHLEVRQTLKAGGYNFRGRVDYTHAELLELLKGENVRLVNGADGRDWYKISHVEIKVDEDKVFDNEVASGVYCTVQLTRPSWKNAIGAPIYRWGYCDTIFILDDGLKIPDPVIYLYNLDANTYKGAIIRDVLADLGIEVRTINSENLGQNVGYLGGWYGYEPVEDPYDPEAVSIEYVLYCNVPEVYRVAFVDKISAVNCNVSLKSKLTEWGAVKTLKEMIGHLGHEADVFNAVLELSTLVHKAQENVPEATYGSNEQWPTFKAKYDECVELLTQSEQAKEVYEKAYSELYEIYMKITNKKPLSGEFFLVATQEADGTYTVTCEATGAPQDQKVTYEWQNGSQEEKLTGLTENDLRKVKLTLQATGAYDGWTRINFLAPEKAEFTLEATHNRVSVKLEDASKVRNTLVPITYTASLYQGEELVETISNTTADAIVFENLEENQEYLVRVQSENSIGHTEVAEDRITTEEAPEETPGEDGSDETPGEDSNPGEDSRPGEDVSDGNPSDDSRPGEENSGDHVSDAGENDDKKPADTVTSGKDEGKDTAPKTGDTSMAVLCMGVAIAMAGVCAVILGMKKKRSHL